MNLIVKPHNQFNYDLSLKLIKHWENKSQVKQDHAFKQTTGDRRSQ